MFADRKLSQPQRGGICDAQMSLLKELANFFLLEL
jgi:hypothetical protein